jgi:hypothetical protein
MKNRRAELRAYASKPITYTQHGLLWHMPTIAQYITEFTVQHKVTGASAQVVLLRPLVHESVAYAIKNLVLLEDLVPDTLANHTYMHSLLGPYEDHYLFYVVRVARALLFQIELLLLKTPLRLVSISTEFAAELQLYKRIKGVAYRAVDLTYVLDHQTISLNIDWQTVMPSLMVAHAVQHDDLACALGSFLGDR